MDSLATRDLILKNAGNKLTPHTCNAITLRVENGANFRQVGIPEREKQNTLSSSEIGGLKKGSFSGKLI